ALKPRPALGLDEARAPDERTRRLLFEREQAVTAELPVAEDHRDLPPRVRPLQRLAVAEIPHDFHVRADGGVGVEIVLAEHPQAQPLGLEGHARKRSSICTSAPRRAWTSPSWRSRSPRAR